MVRRVTPAENAPLLVESIGPLLGAKPPCERRTLIDASGSLVARRVEPMLVGGSLEFMEGSPRTRNRQKWRSTRQRAGDRVRDAVELGLLQEPNRFVGLVSSLFSQPLSGPGGARPGRRPPMLRVMADESLIALAGQQFVALTTFKRNGEGVVTPMWIGRDGDALFVWTPADAWKVKRVAHDPRVLLAPSGRFGKVRDGVTPVAGTAEVITEPATVERLRRVIQRKYGLGYWVITTIEAIAARGRKPRVILSISLSE